MKKLDWLFRKTTVFSSHGALPLLIMMHTLFIGLIEPMTLQTGGQVGRKTGVKGWRDEKTGQAIQANAREKFRQPLSKTFEHNTFMRKGIVGDWKNHFSQEDLEEFNKIAGGAMATLGYE